MQEAIARMIQLRAAQPDFRREELAETLSGAYVVLGRQMAEASSLEEAVQLYDKALELKPNDAQIQVERHMIAGYVDVKTYWGADWTRVINLLEDLYRRDPNYRNVQYPLAEGAYGAWRRLRTRAGVVCGHRRIHERDCCA